MTYSHLAVIVALLSGCTDPSIDYVLSVPTSFNDEQLETMHKEAEHLCSVTDGRHCPVITREHSSSKVVLSREISGYDFLVNAETTIDRSDGHVVVEISDSGMKHINTVFRHELGHVVGCDEELPKGNVMTLYRQYQPNDWTEADIACMGRVA